MYQIYDQYMKCICAHCQQIQQQSFELSINPKFDAIQQFYQKNGRCVNITDVTTFINANFQETYTDDQIQKRFATTLLPKTLKLIPQGMADELKITAQSIYPDQTTIVKKAIAQHMTAFMKEYNVQSVKDNMKNWITRNKTPIIQRQSEEEISTSIRIIVEKYSKPNQEETQPQENLALCALSNTLLSEINSDNTTTRGIQNQQTLLFFNQLSPIQSGTQCNCQNAFCSKTVPSPDSQQTEGEQMTNSSNDSQEIQKVQTSSISNYYQEDVQEPSCCQLFTNIQ
ncbi:Hypothetical_protein [Hexamita inflata]|uniref:Hypothetical_protein n=1 Tax=Hexamita inflata TaxID=28002 RepID=A0AA86UYU7_9EUKA|nr:Hypothetical protein HINF_LOCUS57466 [Hexamita inflata]